MIETVAAGGTLQRSLQAATQQARSRGEPVLISWTEAVPSITPLDLYERGRRLDSHTFYWERPVEQFAIAAVGVTHTLTVDGADRFGEAARAWQRLLDRAMEHGSVDVPGTGPVALGGFSFDPLRARTPRWQGFPSGRLDLPQYMLTAIDDSCWLTVNTVVQPASDPDAEARRLTAGLCLLRGSELRAQRHPEGTRLTGHGSSNIVNLRSAASWKALVCTARDAIRRGEIEKIVLARAVCALGDGTFQPAVGLSRLRQGYPGCTLFAVSYEGSTFLGATPERLVRLRGGTVQVDCLAGTIGRGSTDHQDRRLGARLLRSAKDRSEHAVVLRMLKERLAATCSDLQIPPEPALMKLRNVQHLYTPISAKLVNGHSILALVEQLHPSPAVGGFPVDAARQFIREREDLDRGWYAAPIGWMDPHGEGEFAVAIRSALVRGKEATLFAGCGIMADSDPEAEYDESCLKLQSMLSILDGSQA